MEDMNMETEFTDTRNCWESREAPKVDGNWCDIKSELIKLAAGCAHYASDIVIDINGIDGKLRRGEEFEAHLYFYECGVHSTLEYPGNEWTEEQKCSEIRKHCSGTFATAGLSYRKTGERDYVLKFTGSRLKEE